ncbi:hypothetical protein DSCW_59770 [Desulfosarcina widdelii]|uniref:HTH cro/C1-type domain-containing protein n=1 Tax=Desulfosarcina widdelii TaxID=947919 RepID=A0A5K7ZCL3_9BACT|nr:helix-turn-helix domain-containing protein [Desulfosarcina widdelii]BBO78560.1 hypothetical protein DSCW_59770 [Desulfosarcina widdelii]
MEIININEKLPADDFDKVYGRLKMACGVHTDKEFADVLGIKRQAITAARKRESVPSNWIVAIADKFSVSLDWLKYGIFPEWKRNTALQIERLKKICNVETDEQFAKFLNITKATVEKVRNNDEPVPHSWYLKITKKTNVSFDRLTFGIGPHFSSEFEKGLIDDVLEKEEIFSSIDVLPINESWIEKIVVQLEKRLAEMKCALSPKRKAYVISASYESFWHDDQKRADLKVVDACLRTALKSENDSVKK